MNRQELGNETYKKIYKKSRNTKFSTDPELINIFDNFTYGEIYHIGDLDDKTRELISICLLTIKQVPKILKKHTVAALNCGATPLEIREAVYLCATFIGFPQVVSAAGIINEVFVEKGFHLPLENQTTVTEENRLEKGREIKSKFFKKTFEENLKGLPENYDEILNNVIAGSWFGDFYTRGVLDVAKRELLCFPLVAMFGTNHELEQHAKANQEIGNYKETLIEVMIQSIPFIGFPIALNAISIINETMDY